jgi:hypothetical protein
MSFEARNLRIQLPCRQVTILDCGVGITHLCGNPTVLCPAQSIVCHFPTQVCVQYASICGIHSCAYATCGWQSICPLHTQIGCQVGGTFKCPGSWVEDPGELIIDAEQIGALRESLEAQLKELDDAEAKLREFRDKEKGG